MNLDLIQKVQVRKQWWFWWEGSRVLYVEVDEGVITWRNQLKKKKASGLHYNRAVKLTNLILIQTNKFRSAGNQQRESWRTGCTVVIKRGRDGEQAGVKEWDKAGGQKSSCEQCHNVQAGSIKCIVTWSGKYQNGVVMRWRRHWMACNLLWMIDGVIKVCQVPVAVAGL